MPGVRAARDESTMAQGGSARWEVFQTRTARLRSAQVVVVASAGNSATDWCASHYNPSTTPHKLLVGATTQGGALASFSNYGACVQPQVPLRRGFAEAFCPSPRPHIRARLPATVSGIPPATRPPVSSALPKTGKTH